MQLERIVLYALGTFVCYPWKPLLNAVLGTRERRAAAAGRRTSPHAGRLTELTTPSQPHLPAPHTAPLRTLCRL